MEPRAKTERTVNRTCSTLRAKHPVAMRITIHASSIMLLCLILYSTEFFAQTQRNGPGKDAILWSPPKMGWPDQLPRPTVPKEMIGSLRVANMPIILEETTLEGVQKRLGGTLGSRGDAGEAEAWLCFCGSDSEGPWIFWLTSGELDGPAISGFQWRSLSPGERPDRRCRQLSLGSGRIELPLAIHLRMTEMETRRILGIPTIVRGKLLIFSHEHKQVIRGETYSVSNDIAVALRDGVVWAIEVAKSTSN